MKLILTENELLSTKLDRHQDKELVEEGLKEILIGAAMLAGVSLGAQTETQIQGNEKEVITKLQDVIKNDSLLTKISNAIEERTGEDGVKEKIIKNNKKLIKHIKKGGKITKSGEFSKERQISGKVNQELGIINMNFDDIDSVKNVSSINVDSTITYNPNNLFKTASYEINTNAMSDYVKQLNKLVDDGFEITNVTIKSGTDKEPIRTFISDDDSTGNKTLSKKRAESISDLLKGVVDSNKIDIKLFNDLGPDIYDRTMSSQERDSAREKTKEYRFVVVEVSVIKFTSQPDPPSLENSLELSCEFISIVGEQKNSSIFDKIKLKLPKIGLKFKNKSGGKVIKCPSF